MWYNGGSMSPSLPLTLAAAFPKRPADLHKYTAGTVAVVGGSARYPHAPVIAALGARAAGAGLVQLMVPDVSRIAAGALVPEATFCEQASACALPRADVTAMGMGLGNSPDGERLVSRILSASPGRFVLDADALGLLAKWHAAGSLPKEEGQTLVLTPHVGEAARLLACTTEEIQSDRPAAVRRIADRYQATTVLKGPHTLVAAPGREDLFECEAGNPFRRRARRALGVPLEDVPRPQRRVPRRLRRRLAARRRERRGRRRKSPRRSVNRQHRTRPRVPPRGA